MRKRVFRPAPLDGLEARLVLSAVAAHVPAQVEAPPASSGSVVHGLSRPSRDSETGQFEIRWMREMAGHHGMAIQMARLALRNSSNPEVVSLARGIVRAQMREVHQLRGWLSGWYGVRNVRPVATPEDREMFQELGSRTGAEFDRSFLSMMIEHHRAAVDDANELLSSGSHRALRKLGANVIRTQTAEIQTMQSLLGSPGGHPMGGHRA